MTAKVEGTKIADIVKSERDLRGSREDLLIDASQTIVLGAVCRDGAAGRKALLGAEANEVQTVSITGTLTAGFYTLTFIDEDGEAQTAPVAYDASDNAAVQTAVDTAMPAGEVVVGGTVRTAQTFTFSGASVQGKTHPLIDVDYGGVTGAEDADVVRTTTGGWGAGAGADEVQTATVTGTPASGTYTLTFIDESGDTKTTPTIAWDVANTAAVQAVLDTLLGSDQVIAGGTVITAQTFTFSGSNYEKRNVPMMTMDVSLLLTSAPAVVTVAVVENTKGGRGGEPEANCIALEAQVVGAVYTTKGVFLVRDAIVDVDKLDFGAGNKIDAIAQLKKVGIVSRKEAPVTPTVQP